MKKIKVTNRMKEKRHLKLRWKLPRIPVSLILLTAHPKKDKMKQIVTCEGLFQKCPFTNICSSNPCQHYCQLQPLALNRSSLLLSLTFLYSLCSIICSVCFSTDGLFPLYNILRFDLCCPK